MCFGSGVGVPMGRAAELLACGETVKGTRVGVGGLVALGSGVVGSSAAVPSIGRKGS